MHLNLMPLKPMSKSPLGEWKRLQTEKYIGEFPDTCNIGVICGKISDNLFVVDLDSFDLYDNFKDIETLTVKTGKGYHLYFKTDILPENRKFDDYRLRHVDIKSEGGYVLAPESIHPETKQMYMIVKDVPILKIDPQIILERLQTLGFNVQKKTIDEIKEGVTEGGRNDSTFKYACYLMRQGVYGDALKLEVDKLNAKHKPPLSEYELDIIIKQAHRYEGKTAKEPAPVMITFEGLKEKLISMKEEKQINLTKQLPEYVKALGEEAVIDLIKQYIPNAIVSCVDRVSLHEISPTIHEGVPVEFDALVLAVGDRTTYTRRAEFYCPKCQKRETVECDELYMLPYVPKCSTHKVSMKIDQSTKETGYIQQIRIQEFMENAINNTPVEADAQIVDESVGSVFFGDRCTFVAKLRSFSPKDPTRDFNITYYEIISFKIMDQRDTCMPTEEELDKWKKTPNMFDRVTDSIAPEQYMEHLRELKQSGMLCFTGGMSLNGKRSNINVGWIGDAQLGKSELALALHKVVPGAGYTQGCRLSKAGLTIGMVTMHNNRQIPQAGFFPRHHNKPVVFDEGDKATKDVIEATYEIMEQQTCTITLTGTNGGLTLPASCPVLMCANPKNGKFNKGNPRIMDNFNFPEPFITRFDILFLIVDENNPDLDRKIREHIRNFDASKYMKLDELQRYFSYARSLRPTVPKHLEERIDILHGKMRPLNKIESIPIGIRQYYGLYRLLTASAALHLREVVTEEDFQVVENIISVSLKSLGMNLQTGEVQDRFHGEKSTKEVVFKTLWTKLLDEFKTVDKTEFLEKLGSIEPFTPKSAQRMFDDYLNAGAFEIDTDTGRYKFK